MDGEMHSRAQSPGDAPVRRGTPMPQDQQAYTALVSNAMRMIYDERIMPQLLKTIRGDGTNPAQNLGLAVAGVMAKLESTAGKAGQQFSPEVKTAAAKEIVEIVAELAGPQGADLYEFSREDMQSAVWAASNAYNASASQQGAQQGQPPQGQQGLPQQPQPQPQAQRRPSRLAGMGG